MPTAPVTYINHTTSDGGNNSRSNLILNRPSGIQVGDVLIAIIAGGNPSNSGHIPTPSGWTEIDYGYDDSDASGITTSISFKACYKIVNSTDLTTGSYTFGFNGMQLYPVGTLIAYRGVWLSQPVYDLISVREEFVDDDIGTSSLVVPYPNSCAIKVGMAARESLASPPGVTISSIPSGYTRIVNEKNYDAQLSTARSWASMSVMHYLPHPAGNTTSNTLFFDGNFHIAFGLTIVVNATPPPSPPTISGVPNNTHTAILLSGSTIDTNTATLVVQSSSDNVNFSTLGNGVISGTLWSLSDSIGSIPPGASTLSTPIISGRNVQLSWSAVSQSSLTRYYKTYRTLNDGDITVFSNTISVTATPIITKYSIERIMDNQSSWVKIADVDANATEYTDTTLPIDISAQYRIIAVNSQDSTSVSNSVTTKINPPAPPVFSTLDVVDGTTFRLSGSGAVVSG